MNIGFMGMTHLGKTLRQASELRGFGIRWPHEAELVFITYDVEDHAQLAVLDNCVEQAFEQTKSEVPIVLVSQVPPGYTRKWAGHQRAASRVGPFYYQVDTIIMNCALLRATFPERIIVGRAGDLSEPLHPNYMRWLEAFDCPILEMSYESAEMCKLAVNYYLAKQVETTNILAEVAASVGAAWDDMIPALRLDARIGPKAYLRPGTIEGSHLPRDVNTIEQLRILRTADEAHQPAA